MRNNTQVIIMAMLTLITVFTMIIAVNCGYGRMQLRYFNDLNHTSYTIKQWRIYEYDIKKLYPFVDQR